MKSFFSLLALVVASVLFLACKGDIGPEGAKGPTGDAGLAGTAGAKGDKGVQGDKGPAGANGNVDVVILNDTGFTIASGIGNHDSFVIGYDVLSRAQAEASGIFVYVKLPREQEEWASIPGTIFFPGGSHQTFGLSVNFREANLLLQLIRSEGTGDLVYSGIKIIFVPKSATARQAAIDYSDYAAVKDYYNLPD